MEELTVAGGGIGGLTAAVSAGEQGLKVRLLEAKPVLGGRGRTTDAPFRANWGPHVIYSDGPLWRWLDQRGLARPARRAPLTGQLLFRVEGRTRRSPPRGLVSALLHLRRRPAPVDESFLDWASPIVGDLHAHRLAMFVGVATFDHDPGRLSAAFVNERLRRATIRRPSGTSPAGGRRWSTVWPSGRARSAC